MSQIVSKWPGEAVKDAKGNVAYVYGTCIKMDRWGVVTREGRMPIGAVKTQWIEIRPYSSQYKLLFLTDRGLVMGLSRGERVRLHYRSDATGGFWVGEKHDWGTNR